MNMKNFGIVEGRLTRDIELKTNEAGNVRGYINIAVNRNFKNKDGNYDTDFISFAVFGKTAEFAEKYFKKGSPIKIQFTVRSFTKEVEVDGKTTNRTQIDLVAEAIEFPMTASRQSTNEENPASQETSNTNDFSGIDADDDLPF